MLYALCNFKPPFDHHFEMESESYAPMSVDYSPRLRELIGSCLSFSPQTRPNALRLFQVSHSMIETSNLPSATANEKTIQSRIYRFNRATASLRKIDKISDRTPKFDQLADIEPSDHQQQCLVNSGSTGQGQNRIEISKAVESNSNLQMASFQDGLLLAAVEERDEDLAQQALQLVDNANSQVATASLQGIVASRIPGQGENANQVQPFEEARTSVDQSSKALTHALLRAAKDGSLAIVQALLETGTSVNAADENGRTALSYSSQYNRILVIEALLVAKADPNVQDRVHRRAAIHYAALEAHWGVCDLLIAHGATTNIIDVDNDAAAAIPRFKYDSQFLSRYRHSQSLHSRASNAEETSDPTGHDSDGITPLSSSDSIASWSEETATKLPDLGANFPNLMVQTFSD